MDLGITEMTIESDDLAALRETTSKALLGLLWLHVPIALAIGMMRGNGWLAPTCTDGCDGDRRDRVVAPVRATGCRPA